jgi:hypothetical protein
MFVQNGFSKLEHPWKQVEEVALLNNEFKSTNLNHYRVVKVNQIYHALISFYL